MNVQPVFIFVRPCSTHQDTKLSILTSMQLAVLPDTCSADLPDTCRPPPAQQPPPGLLLTDPPSSPWPAREEAGDALPGRSSSREAGAPLQLPPRHHRPLLPLSLPPPLVPGSPIAPAALLQSGAAPP